MMLLYHGTSWEAFAKIVNDSQGLRPRKRRVGNWNHSVTSNPNAVYLTNAYALHFAFHAAKSKKHGAIIEVDTVDLKPDLLCPDEDAIEQVMRGKDDLPSHWTMERRTTYYRKRMARSNEWEKSINAMGTCAYMGAIPSIAFSRVAQIDYKTMLYLVMNGFDPSVGVLNYKFLGDRYRNFMKWIFDPDVEIPGIEHLERDGIVIHDLWVSQ